MSSVSAIFFDWGGVIAGDPDDGFLEMLLAQNGATKEQVQEIHDSYMRSFMRGEISESGYWQIVRERYGLTIPSSISEEFKKWRGLAANEMVFALVDEARAAGLKTAVFTNVIEPTYNVLKAAGYYERFDAVIASCKVGLAKPQPEIYQLALDYMHTAAEQSLFIDDKQRNLDPAIVMGFKTILAQNPEQIIRGVRAYIHASKPEPSPK